MAEAVRVHCCIVGCRRSFRADRIGGADQEIICGKHWRAVDPKFLLLHKQSKRFLAKLIRKWPDAKYVPMRRAKLCILAIDRRTRRWNRVKREAQYLQDSGYFARRPRLSRVKQLVPVPKLGKSFEREFQAAKQRMAAGGRR